MKYSVDPWNNFCRVFEVPKIFPINYRVGRRYKVNFQMVDWFQPLPMRLPLILNKPHTMVSKKTWEKEVGPVETVEVDMDKLAEKLILLVRQKQYFNPDHKYLILCDFGGSIYFEC